MKVFKVFISPSQCYYIEAISEKEAIHKVLEDIIKITSNNFKAMAVVTELNIIK